MSLLAISSMVKSQSLPWWVNAVYKVGVPTAIACYLVWFLTNKVQTNLEVSNIHLNNMESLMSQHITDMKTNSDINAHILMTLRKICINQSETRTDRDECLK